MKCKRLRILPGMGVKAKVVDAETGAVSIQSINGGESGLEVLVPTADAYAIAPHMREILDDVDLEPTGFREKVEAPEEPE